MEDQQQQPQNTTLCYGGCGFYGSSATEGLCSKCFKDSIKRKQDTTTTSTSATTSSSSSSSSITPRIVAPNSASIDTVIHAAASTSSNNNINNNNNNNNNNMMVCSSMDNNNPNNNNNNNTSPILNSSTLSSVTIMNDLIGAQLEKKIEECQQISVENLQQQLTSCDSTQSLASMVSTDGSVGTSAGGPISSSATKKFNRCNMCKKRVGLTGFTCRCGGLYCGEHRYDQAHNCDFDYKTVEREEIRKNNPVVISDKIQRI